MHILLTLSIQQALIIWHGQVRHGGYKEVPDIAPPLGMLQTSKRDQHVSKHFRIIFKKFLPMCFPIGSGVKNPLTNAGDMGLIPRSGREERSPEEGNGNPIQYSCLENPMERETCWTTVHGLQRAGHDWRTKQHNTPYHWTLQSMCTWFNWWKTKGFYFFWSF